MADPNPADGSHLPPPPPPPVPARVEAQVLPVRWGLGDAALGWLIAYASAAFLGALILAATGHAGDEPSQLSMRIIALTYPPLWLGFVAVPIWAAATKGNGWLRDFRVALRAKVDIPLGIACGLAAQYVLAPLVTAPILRLFDKTAGDLAKPAQDLADKATDNLGIVLFFVIVGIGAPLAEELFWRGLVLRSFENRLGSGWAVALTSVLFAASHFQALQFAGLAVAGAVFGYLAIRTGRLGPSICAHMAFNISTVVYLVWIK
jgi:membrane protease YdiL (CAAX protease family)